MYFMTRLRHFIVHLKAWQAFLFQVAPMFVSQVFFTNRITGSFSPGQTPDIAALRNEMFFVMASSAVMLGLLCLWLWSAASCSNQAIGLESRPSMRWYYRCGAFFCYGFFPLVFGSFSLESIAYQAGSRMGYNKRCS